MFGQLWSEESFRENLVIQRKKRSSFWLDLILNKQFYKYTNADLKICQHLYLHLKIICRRFQNERLLTFWDIHTWDMWKVCLQTFRNNRIRKKLAYFFRKLQTSRAKSSRILRIKKAKFSGYCFYVNTNM